MKKHYGLIIIFTLLIATNTQAQGVLEWYKTGKRLYYPFGFKYDNGQLIYNKTFNSILTNPLNRGTYDGNMLNPIGRTHNNTLQSTLYNNYNTSLTINDTSGEMASVIISENSNSFYNAYSNGDTLIMFEHQANPSPSRIYVQIKDIHGGFLEKSINVIAHGKNRIWGPLTLIKTNDLHHVYGIMRVSADSINISGKNIPCSRNYSNVLCCFDYKGNFLWGFDICSADKDLTLVDQLCSYELDESGVGYFSGYIKKNDAWILGDYFEFKGSHDPFAPEEFFVVRIAPGGKAINKKFFNTYNAQFGINTRFKGHFYFKSYIHFYHNTGYVFKELGYTISGTNESLNATSGYVVGEMDTNFNIIWYKVLPYELKIKTNNNFGDPLHRNLTGLVIRTPSGSLINEKNEFIYLTSRSNQVYLDYNRTALFADSTGNLHQPVLMKVSRCKGFQHLYSFGFNVGEIQDYRNAKSMNAPAICEGKPNEYFVSFVPPGQWGIGGEFYLNSPPPINEGHTVFAKVTYYPMPEDTICHDSIPKDSIPQDSTINNIHKHIPSGHINIYPNPANDIVYISSSTSSAQQQAMQAELYSMDGKKVYTKTLTLQPGREVPLPLAGIKPGMYILRIRGSDGHELNKVLVKQE